MGERLEPLEQQLELIIEQSRQLSIIASDFQPQGQNLLNQKIQNLIQSLQELDRLRLHVQDIKVPMEVFQCIDAGKNPQLFTRDCMERAVEKNEQVKGKIESYARFRHMLLVELSKEFPNEMGIYRAIRGDDRKT